MDKTNDKQIILDVSNETFLKLLIYSNVTKQTIPAFITHLINKQFNSIDFNQLISRNNNLKWFDLIADLERGYYDKY